MKKLVLFSLVILLFSCSTESVVQKDGIKILVASQKLVFGAASYLSELKNGNLSSSKFDLSNFKPSELKEIRINYKGASKSSFGILSSTNPSVVLMINFNFEGSVESAAISENIVLADKSIETKIYDLDGNLGQHLTTVGRKIISHKAPNIEGLRTSKSWFGDTGDCIEKAGEPFENGLSNLLFDAAATVVTSGWFPVVLTVACGIRSL
jgi:hypothetical protein